MDSASEMAAQRWDAQQYARDGRFVATLAGDVLTLLEARPGERILDLGCGDGVLAEALATAGCLVTAVDADASMIAAARARGLEAAQEDMRRLSFSAAFDAVFSNAALHWVREQDDVVAGVRRALRTGGRFVAEMGGAGNIAAIRTALRAVFFHYGIDAEEAARSFFPSPAQYTALLQRHGFLIERMELIPRPTALPAGMCAWLRTFRRGVLERLDPVAATAVVQEVCSLLEPVLMDADGTWRADYVRLRFRARRTD